MYEDVRERGGRERERGESGRIRFTQSSEDIEVEFGDVTYHFSTEFLHHLIETNKQETPW